jgi:hypothetical protein
MVRPRQNDSEQRKNHTDTDRYEKGIPRHFRLLFDNSSQLLPHSDGAALI